MLVRISMPSLNTSPQTSQRGFTLLEILIAVMVLSLGLLGIAGMQLSGTRHTYDAYLHSMALVQAQDMADRIRANIEGMRDGDYNAISSTPADPGCAASGCTTAEMATYDAFRWNTDNAALLPSGAGAVTCTDVNATTTTMDIGSSCTITVRWDASRNGATGTGCNPADAADLRCVRLSIVP